VSEKDSQALGVSCSLLLTK